MAALVEVHNTSHCLGGPYSCQLLYSTCGRWSIWCDLITNNSALHIIQNASFESVLLSGEWCSDIWRKGCTTKKAWKSLLHICILQSDHLALTTPIVKFKRHIFTHICPCTECNFCMDEFSKFTFYEFFKNTSASALWIRYLNTNEVVPSVEWQTKGEVISLSMDFFFQLIFFWTFQTGPRLSLYVPQLLCLHLFTV